MYLILNLGSKLVDYVETATQYLITKIDAVNSCDTILPIDIIVYILRRRKSLFHLSRTVSKTIRNKSLNDIFQHELRNPISNTEISLLNEPYSILEDKKWFVPDQMGCYNRNEKCIITFADDTCHPIYFHRCDADDALCLGWGFGGIRLKELSYDQISSLDKLHKPKLDIDFVSYYKIILQRLQYYDCDKQKYALAMTLDKFDKMSNSEYGSYRVNFLLILCGTANILGVTIPSPINQFDVSELITLLEQPVRTEIIKL